MSELEPYMLDLGRRARAAARILREAPAEARTRALELLARKLSAAEGDILAANARDVEAARAGGMTEAMIDRLSILALKIFHMREQTERMDADFSHIEACRNKLERLIDQRKDLACCLDTLLQEAAQGRAYFKVYRQFKMYNDPTLNPYLYTQQRAQGTGGKAAS